MIRNLHRSIALLIFCAILLPGAAATREYPVVERFDVEMTDGIHLATDVYYPQNGADPWPVLLFRTPYNIEWDNIGYAAEQGWAVVCQDLRGRYASEGIDRMFLDDGWGPDHQDGLETVEWILAQPWCDGKIGSYGGSARGITQNQLAGALPPGVECQYVIVAPASLYHQAAFPGGAFRERDVVGWLQGQGSEHMLDSLLSHPNYDDYWTWLDSGARDPLVTLPTYQLGGWYDLFAEGTIAKFTGLQYGGGPGALGNQKLVMGAWTHGSGTGELVYPPNASLDKAWSLVGSDGEWLGYWLRGEPNGIMDLPAIAYYVMGDVDDPGAPGNEWRTGELWPPPAAEQSWYLHAGGALSRALPGADDPPAVYDFDPSDPVPTIGGANLIAPHGPYDQRPVEGRDDVLLYTSAVLDEAIEIAGPVRLILHASSNRVDTDFTGKLCDVYPDGRSMLVCDGVLRARHRLSMSEEDFLVPGEVYELEIAIGETAIAFAPGHRIRLAVSSSNHDRFDVNPNTGAPFAYSYSEYLIATNTVYQDALRPSHLLLRVTNTTTSVASGEPEAAGLRLLGIHPNPCNPRATLRFRLGEPGRVRASVHDLRGALVTELTHAEYPAGEHALVWSGRDRAGRSVSSGVYLVRVEAEGRVRTGKLLLLR